MILEKGRQVSVCRISDANRSWEAHTMRTTIDAKEYRTKDVFGSSGAIILHYGGWLILTRRRNSRSWPAKTTSIKSSRG